MHKLLTPKIIFVEFIKQIFAPRALAGFGVGQIIALPPKFSSLAVDNKVIYPCKKGFFVGICVEKGARSLVSKKKETVVSRSSRYSGHDGRVRGICYYETRPSCP